MQQVAIIKDGVGEYRRGDVVPADKLAAFLESNPSPDTYLLIADAPAPVPPDYAEKDTAE